MKVRDVERVYWICGSVSGVPMRECEFQNPGNIASINTAKSCAAMVNSEFGKPHEARGIRE